ncbi:MAG: helix-turn-helix transcriptional regulator [Candidatus Limnocylindrales bacterium]
MSEHFHHQPEAHHGQGRGWRPTGPRHRWLEPFLLVLIAGGTHHGYGLVARLNVLGVAPRAVDVGELYRTLRELEMTGLVRSEWTSPLAGARRREYVLTESGDARLAEWVAVMQERARLVGEFLAEYKRSVHGGAVSAEAGKEA